MGRTVLDGKMAEEAGYFIRLNVGERGTPVYPPLGADSLTLPNEVCSVVGARSLNPRQAVGRFLYTYHPRMRRQEMLVCNFRSQAYV